MAGTWTSEKFPQFEGAVRRLAEQHRELEDEPLHLAISYRPLSRDQQDIYLFEVIGSPSESINPERDLFEATYGASPEFPMSVGEQLHLILSNPRELKVALEQSWPLAVEVVKAIRDSEYRVLFSDEIGDQILRTLEKETRSVAWHG